MAYWLQRYGFEVTVVGKADDPPRVGPLMRIIDKPATTIRLENYAAPVASR